MSPITKTKSLFTNIERRWEDSLDLLLKKIDSKKFHHNLDNIFEIIDDELKKINAFTIISIIDEKKQNLIIRHINIESDFNPFFSLRKIRVFEFDRLDRYKEALEKREVIFLNNRISQLRKSLPEIQTFPGEDEIHSILAPLILKNEVIGFLEIFSPDLKKDFISIIETFSKKLVLYIENTILFHEIKETEKRYRSIFEKARDGFYVLNGKRGRFTDVNKKLCEISGYTKDELLQMNYLLLFEKEERKKIEHYVKKRLSRVNGNEAPPKKYKTSIITKNGDIKFIKLSIVKFLSEDEWFVIIEDITKFRKTQIDLKENKEKFKFVFESSLDTMVVTDNQKKIIEFNQAAQDSFGYTLDEIKGQKIHILYPDKKIGLKIAESLKKTGKFEGKIKNIRKNGEIFDSYLSVSAIKDIYGNIIGTMGSSRDITRQLKAERELQESEERYKNLFENASSATITIEEDMTISMANAEFRKLTGYTKKEVEGKMKWTDFIPKEELKKILKNYNKIKNEHHIEHEFDLIDKHEKIKKIVAKISSIPGSAQSIASLIDITYRIKSEKALKHSEEKYRKLVNNAEDAVLIINTNGNITFSNKAFYEISGYTKEDSVDLHFSKLVHDDDKQKVLDNFNQKIKGNKKIKSYEFKVITKNGKIKTMSYSDNTIVRNNEIVGVQAIIRDVTENKKLQEEIENKLNYEMIISNISYKSLIANDLNKFLNETLKFLGSRLNADRSFICRKEMNQDILKNTHEWCNQYIKSRTIKSQKIHKNHILFTNTKTSSDLIKINNTNIIKEISEKKFFLQNSIKSILASPLIINNKKIGLIGLETINKTREWKEEELVLLKTISNIISQDINNHSLQNKLILSRNHYEKVINTINDAICVISKDKKIISANKIFAKQVNLPFKKIEGSKCSTIIPRFKNGLFKNHCLNNFQPNSCMINSVLINKKTITHVEKNLDKKGKINYHNLSLYPDINEKGDVEQIVLTIRDITKRKIDEDEIRRLNEFNKRVLDNAPVSIIAINTNGDIIASNEYYKNISSSKNLINKNIYKMPFFKKEKLIEKYKELLDKGTSFSKINCKTTNQSGETKYLNIIAVPLRNKHGEIERAISMAVDNTESIITKEKIEKLNQDLEKKVIQRTWQLDNANKDLNKALDLKSKFISDASHELRTPLTIIQGNLDLAKQLSKDNEMIEMYALIQKEIERMAQILSDLNLLSNADANTEKIENEIVDLNIILRAVSQSMEVLAKQKNIKIKIKKNNPKNSLIMGDEAKLEKLLINLIRNAIKYSNKDKTIELSIEKSSTEIRIIVKDRGIGIPEQELPYIFERFYRVEKSRSRSEGGTGLGLSICKYIAEAHNGRISVKSKIGEGSEFTISLPLDPKNILNTL